MKSSVGVLGGWLLFFLSPYVCMYAGSIFVSPAAVTLRAHLLVVADIFPSLYVVVAFFSVCPPVPWH